MEGMVHVLQYPVSSGLKSEPTGMESYKKHWAVRGGAQCYFASDYDQLFEGCGEVLRRLILRRYPSLERQLPELLVLECG